MRSTVFKWTIYDSSWLLKFSPNVQRPWWIFRTWQYIRPLLYKKNFIILRFFWRIAQEDYYKALSFDTSFQRVYDPGLTNYSGSVHQWGEMIVEITTWFNEQYTPNQIAYIWPIRLSVRTQDSQSWKSSSILLLATIIYCGVEQW